MKVKALIAARSGSIRVKNKNIRPFAGSSLLEVKIEQLKRIKNLDGIVVNSNDEKILTIARRMGVEVVERDPYYASNAVSMSEVYKNMAENIDCDVIAYINCTNPLVEDESIEKAIDMFKYNNGAFDSINSAHLIKEFLFENNKPINYDLKNQPRSQDLPDIMALNFAFSILSKKTMIDCMNVVGNKPYLYVISQTEATDIDNQIDFDFAEFVFNKNHLK